MVSCRLGARELAAAARHVTDLEVRADLVALSAKLAERSADPEGVVLTSPRFDPVQLEHLGLLRFTVHVYAALLDEEQCAGESRRLTRHFQRWRDAGRGGEVDAALRLSRRSPWLREWLRLGVRSAASFARLLMWVLCWTVLWPFGLLARHRVPIARWRPARQTDLSSQY